MQIVCNEGGGGLMCIYTQIYIDIGRDGHIIYHTTLPSPWLLDSGGHTHTHTYYSKSGAQLFSVSDKC